MLDLFCCAGGGAVGYARAGFDLVGVDIRPQPRYPFEFIQADALEFCARHGREFDAIHASPPCQGYSVLLAVCGSREYPDLIAATRAVLMLTGRPWVIENVPRAPLESPAVLCGLALGLRTKRHRAFESCIALIGTVCPPGHPGDWVTVSGHGSAQRRRVNAKSPRREPRGVADARRAMGIDWMRRDELSQAIPPAYTEFIGRQLRAAL